MPVELGTLRRCFRERSPKMVSAATVAVKTLGRGFSGNSRSGTGSKRAPLLVAAGFGANGRARPSRLAHASRANDLDDCVVLSYPEPVAVPVPGLV
jgi:hypothetical protein